MADFVLLAVLIVYAKTCIDQTLLGSDLHNTVMWKSAIWFPLWFSAFSLAVSLSTSSPLLLVCAKC